MKFDDILLKEFMMSYLGHGNSKGEFCFVGLEEGMAINNNILEQKPEHGFEEVNKKLHFWKIRGKNILEDCIDFHMQFDEQWHVNPTRIQNTWDGPIRTILSYEEKEINYSNLLDFQINRFGSKKDNNCLIELRPLPSKYFRGSKWFYKNFSAIDFLQSKSVYEKEITSQRIKIINQFIKHSSFKFVIFLSYSIENRMYWESISETKFEDINMDFLVSKKNNKIFVVTHHPTSYPSKKNLVSGSLKNVYVDLGKYLREKV